MRKLTLLSAGLLSAALTACTTAGTPAVTVEPTELTPANGVTSDAAGVTVTRTGAGPGATFELSLSGDKLPVVTGTRASLTVNVTRRNGFNGAVTLGLGNLPAGASAAPVTVAAGKTSATVTVGAAATAPHSRPTAVTLTGKATGAGAVTKTVTVTVRGPAGSLDTTFGAGGIAVTPVGAGEDVPYALAVQPDGRLIVAGASVGNTTSNDFAVVRLARDGALDPTFGNGGRVVLDFAGRSDTARAVAVQADGKIVVAGGVTDSANEERFGVLRLNTNGTLDPSFGQGGRVVTRFGGSSGDRAQAVLVQPDGKVVVGGSASFGSSTSGVDFALARYTPAGTLDPTFGTGGRVTTAMTAGGAADAVHALAWQNGRIVAAGGEGDFKVARYTAAGALDGSFGKGGRVGGVFAGNIGVANAVAVDGQGRLVLAGQSQNDTAVVRLGGNGAPDPSFGNGGRKVLALSAGNWDAATGVAVQPDGKVVLGGWVYEGGSSAGNFAVTRLNANGQPDAGFGQGGTTITAVAPGSRADEARAVVLQPDERVPTTRIVAAGVRNDANQDFALTRYWP